MTQSTDVSIPQCYNYFRAADSPAGRAIKSRLERRTKSRLDIPDELATAWGRAMNTGDRLGDVYIAEAFATPSGRARARKDVEQALSHGIESVQDPSPELVALFDQINTDPEWLDWNTVEHGAEVFRRYGKELYPYFGMITFSGYALESVAKPLALTGAYTGGSAFGRFMETCRLWTDTSEPGAMRPGGAGRRSAVFVRVLHSIIRHTLLPHPEWDRDRLGVPISQFGMFETLLASSFVPGQQLKFLGYLPTDDDIAAMMHHWRYVGYLMGVEPPWYPETMTEAFQAQLLIALSEVPNVGKDSQELCRSFMDTYLPRNGCRRPAPALRQPAVQSTLGHARFYLGRRSFAQRACPTQGRGATRPLPGSFRT